jgi:chromosome segregation ATPase
MRETSRKGQTMDSEHIEKRLEWLDEQRMKDADLLRGVKEKNSELEKAIHSQAKQIEALSEETARIAALATRIHQMDEALNKHRQEVSRQLETAESRRSEKEKHIEALRKTDQEALVKRIDSVRAELDRLDQIDETLETRRDEQNRLNKQQDSLAKRFDKELAQMQELRGKFKGIEDGQQKDRKNLGQQEGEVTEFKRRLESARHEIEALTDDIRRLDVKTSELSAGEEERREGQAVFFDRQELKLVEFEKGWSDWEQRFKEIENTAASMNEKLIAYDETFRTMKQLRESLDGLIERLERRITEVSEMQRLADERFKQEWNSFQADEHKRWNTFKLTHDEQWRDHEREHGRIENRIEEQGEELETDTQTIQQMREQDENRVRELVAMIREWASAVEKRKR